MHYKSVAIRGGFYNSLLIFLVAFLGFWLSPLSHHKAYSQDNEFINDICLPGELFVLEGVQNNIFVQPLIKRWRPYNDVVRFSGSVDYSRKLEGVASIVNPKKDSNVKLSLINTDEFKTLKTLTANLMVGTPGIGNGVMKVSIIGDSFTQGGFYRSALLDSAYVPGLKMIGLCAVVGHEGQFDEGRGGWTLERYFSVSKDRTQSYNGFWQPEGKYRYWGSVAFWKLVREVSKSPDKNSWSFAEYHWTHRFFGTAQSFDNHGYLENPRKNDLMYDNEANSFIRYDGKSWKQVKYEDFQWSFDYEKYLAMWELESPKILAEFLGLNDFRNAGLPGELDFTQWNNQMEQMIASYHTAVPDGKFVLMIPSSSCGILDNQSGDFTTLQNANMWELRNNIIEQFDNRVDENIYIVDAGISIDNTYGTPFLSDPAYTVPYAGFKGEDRIEVQTSNPHPYSNYPTMGISLAAFIQYHRGTQHPND